MSNSACNDGARPDPDPQPPPRTSDDDIKAHLNIAIDTFFAPCAECRPSPSMILGAAAVVQRTAIAAVLSMREPDERAEVLEGLLQTANAFIRPVLKEIPGVETAHLRQIWALRSDEDDDRENGDTTQ